MEEGSLRCDANVSLRQAGTEAFGTKVEIKNMNSIRSLERALVFEIERQTKALEDGEPIVQETRHWDEDVGRPRSPCARRRRRSTTGTSPSRISRRSSPTHAWIDEIRAIDARSSRGRGATATSRATA